MSTSFQSETPDVGLSKQEALRALLNSFVPDGQLALPNDANVSKLAERLDGLLASKGDLLGAQASIARDDQGRPLNEEGLPIIDIVEPVADDFLADPPPSLVSSQAPWSPLPNWALSPAALAARRRERDRILDILEREEEEELVREADADRATRNEILSSQTVPKHPLPPRTLEQVMRPRMDVPRLSHPTLAQALTDVTIPLDRATETTPGPSMTADNGIVNTEAARKPKNQKSVSFVDPIPADYTNDLSHMINLDIDWGDVIPVPLNPRNTREPRPNVMKQLIVERPPGQPRDPFNRREDSDDEDEVVEDEDDMSPADDSDTEVPAEALRPSGMSDDESDDEEAEVAADVDESDFDEAMLQREIALAYYARRNQVGPDVTSGPLSGSAAMNQTSSGDDRGGVGPRMDNVSNTPRFRRSRLHGDPQTLINSAIQFGKVVDGQLVAGEVADQEVDALLDKLTGGSGDNSAEDLTEETIALLRGGDTPQGESTRSSTQNERARSPVPVTTSTLAPSGNIVVHQPKVAIELKPKPKQTRHLTPSTGKQQSSRQPGSVPAATTQAFPPMIVESGFGFDPAFQVAPKSRAFAAKPVAPMSETVKERPSTPTSHPPRRDRDGSRFAQASRAGGVKSQLSPATPNPETPGDVVERVAPTSYVQLPEPKRISRFRAERAGYL
ncbi:hypothetical protein FRC06_011584 [Ceratobasidium sp. 370]|nr:hypothetical protein FRC06_011584 [Ceratobasidium sp. 370]